VFGITKVATGAWEFAFRGLGEVQQECNLVMSCYNLKRMFSLTRRLTMNPM
jgi:hypothetical protein